MKRFWILLWMGTALLMWMGAAAVPVSHQEQGATAPPSMNSSGSKQVTEDGSSTNNTKGIVVFYRLKKFEGSGLEPSVYCNGVQLARMDNGRYFGVSLEPGHYSFSTNDKQSGAEFDVKAGERYFFRLDITTGFWKGHGQLTMIVKEQGEYEYKKLKPLGKEKIKDPRVLVEISAKN